MCRLSPASPPPGLEQVPVGRQLAAYFLTGRMQPAALRFSSPVHPPRGCYQPVPPLPRTPVPVHSPSAQLQPGRLPSRTVHPAACLMSNACRGHAKANRARLPPEQGRGSPSPWGLCCRGGTVMAPAVPCPRTGAVLVPWLPTEGLAVPGAFAVLGMARPLGTAWLSPQPSGGLAPCGVDIRAGGCRPA